MANPLQAILSHLSKGNANYLGQISKKQMGNLNKSLMDIIQSRAKNFTGDLSDPKVIQQLIQHGMRGGGAAGGGLGALYGFMSAPGTETENVMGVKKTTGPSLGDRLTNALAYGAGGAAVGAGASAYNMRNLAKELMAGGANKINPETLSNFIQSSGMQGGLDKAVANFAKLNPSKVAPNVAKNVAPAANTAFRNADEMTNFISALRSDLAESRKGTGLMKRFFGKSDVNEAMGIQLLSNLTGMPAEDILTNPQFSAILKNNAPMMFSRFDDASLGHIKRIGDAIRNRRFSMAGQGPASLSAGMGPIDLTKAYVGDNLERAKRFITGTRHLGADDLANAMSRGGFDNAATRQGFSINKKGLSGKDEKKLRKSLSSYSNMAQPGKDGKSPMIASPEAPDPAYTRGLRNEAKPFVQAGGALAGAGALGLGSVGLASFLGRGNQQNDDLYAGPSRDSADSGWDR